MSTITFKTTDQEIIKRFVEYHSKKMSEYVKDLIIESIEEFDYNLAKKLSHNYHSKEQETCSIMEVMEMLDLE